jgi:hypothetical protein
LDRNTLKLCISKAFEFLVWIFLHVRVLNYVAEVLLVPERLILLYLEHAAAVKLRYILSVKF